MDNTQDNDDIETEVCDEIMDAMRKAVKRRILEINEDIIGKKNLSNEQIRKMNFITNLTQLYHPVETHKLDLVLQQNQ